MVASYDFWQRALDGEEVGGATLPIHDGIAEVGFWRKRQSRAGAFVGVAIWEHEGALVATIDGKEGDAADVWSYCCRHPVTEEAFRTQAATGKWPDEDGAVAASLAPPAAGHNQPPQDEAEILKGQIEAASANIGDYAEIKDDETAKKAQGVRSRLLELSGEADTKREAEKRPHLDAGTAVDKRWQPVVKMGKALADQLKAAMSAHETRKKTAADAAARAERIEAERVAALQASPVTGPAAVLQPEPPRQPITPTPQVSTQIKPSYGRAASTSIIKVATVTNQDALYGFLKTRPEVIELFATLAQRAVKAGHTPPGVTIEEKVEVR